MELGINIALGALIVLLLVWFIASENSFAFTVMTLLAFAIGFLLTDPASKRRYVPRQKS
jgi:NAD/NADP transhydrogenase beta subunit